VPVEKKSRAMFTVLSLQNVQFGEAYPAKDGAVYPFTAEFRADLLTPMNIDPQGTMKFFFSKIVPAMLGSDCLFTGFDTALPIDPQALVAREDVRAMCAADKCGAYGKNWTCPPYCGTLGECTQKIRTYRRGILVQTVGKLEKTIDTKGYRRTEEKHLTRLHTLYEEIRKEYPNALCLGSGGCRVCGKCAYPEPCRFPEKAISSMEAYGLFVTQVCRDNGAQYYHGEKTVTYTACILY